MSDQDNKVSGERTVSEVAGRRRVRLSKAQTVAIGGATLACAIGLIFWWNPGVKPAEDKSKPDNNRMAIFPYEAPKPVAAQIIPAAFKPTPPLPPPLPFNKKVDEVVTGPAARPAMVSYAVPSVLDIAKPKEAKPAAAAPETTHVDFKPAVIASARTGNLKDMNLTLMPGLIRCTLSTAINSDLAGPLQCVLPADVLSPTGIVLMEKGTQVIGNYASAEMHGERITTVAATAYTPNGVIVPLGGPMADGLGRAGLTGEVDAHLWARFGGAVLLTLFDAALQLGQSALQQGNNNTTLNLGNGGTTTLAQEVLRKQMDIPPTVTVNASSDVGLWVTAPIDFSPSYKLETR
jgi:type IV secretion system protein VirB10